MGSKVKVSLLEKDGVDFFDNDEIDLEDVIVEVKDPAAIGFDIAEDDVRLCLASLRAAADAVVFGRDAEDQTKETDESHTGNSWSEYDSMDFIVTDTSVVNSYRCEINFVWGHNATSNNFRVRLLVDGVQQGEEFDVEPKDAGTDVRLHDSIKRYVNNLAAGVHTLSIEYRPKITSRVSYMYQAVSEVWRTK